MGIQHIQMAFVGWQINRFTHHPARMVQLWNALVQLYQAYKIRMCGIAPPCIQIMHKRRAPGRTQHGRITAQLHGIGRAITVVARDKELGDLPHRFARTTAQVLSTTITQQMGDIGSTSLVLPAPKRG